MKTLIEKFNQNPDIKTGRAIIRKAKRILKESNSDTERREAIDGLKLVGMVAEGKANFFKDGFNPDWGKLFHSATNEIHTIIKTKTKMKNEMSEQAMRRQLTKMGYALKKSRVRNISADNQGGYMIVQVDSGAVCAGSKYDLELKDVEQFINRYR
jgi:hypothetical protein